MLWGTGIRSCAPGTLEGTLQWLVCLPALFWVLSSLRKLASACLILLTLSKVVYAREKSKNHMDCS